MDKLLLPKLGRWSPPLAPSRRSLLLGGVVLVGLGLLSQGIARVQMDFWWFQELGYLENFLGRWLSQILLGAIGGLGSVICLGFQVHYSGRNGRAIPPHEPYVALVARPLQPVGWRWRSDYGLPLGWVLMVGLWLCPWTWPGVVAGSQRYPLGAGILALGIAALVAIALRPLLLLGIMALGVSWAVFWADHWQLVLPAWQGVAFQQTDPVFGQDLGFYIFQLPLGEAIAHWLLHLSLSSLGLVVLSYAQPWLKRGSGAGWSGAQGRHLAGSGAALALALAHYLYWSRYQLLYSQRGAVYGGSYTDLWVSLPLIWLALGASLLLALYLGGVALGWWAQGRWRRFMVYGLCLVGLGYFLLPFGVQRLWVLPNELVLERPYLQNNITATRRAFALDEIEEQTFDPSGNLTAQDLVKNVAAIENIRLWDARPLLQSNRQLQQIRPYYRFVNADIDRYTIGGQPQQVMLSARELDSSSLTGKAATWVNRHLIYTHGYGFTVSPVNRSAAGGLPDYLVKDLENQSTVKELAVDHPRLYYGEIPEEYVLAPSQLPELDYASGNDIRYTSYQGRGGIAMHSGWRRWIGSQYLHNWQILLANNFTPQTRLLIHRSLTERVNKLAPWLTFDRDPYLVIASPGANAPNRLFWVMDAYTTSNHYPYADPGANAFNYLRNSVKITIDAYDGTTTFYASDDRDPILQTWRRIFPSMWRPLAEMPPSLRSHLRYPSDLFRVQADRLRTYHMQDLQTFYNREDLWQIPQEIYDGQPQRVEPYYLITKLPTAKAAEFILLSPFTPNQRTNLIAWLAARSDGAQYGKLLLYKFPKQQLVYGTEQVEALINQDPAISQQISLWSRQGAKAVQGNLLVIPIERSLLYVEPLYLEAQQNSLPTLGRTIVVYRDRIAMAPTLAEALGKIFPSPPVSGSPP